ncbi:LysR substrate-binding domain-containing protein [Amorphus sp. 3PC139-8]|uniref:LysR family transcriptional regulator n=1 Tax=Amorphus sp. 3PC139-8 TaxID=2735676 RepID=UPI00345CB638
MTLDQLKIFVAVAERGHVTRAAESLSMTQSAVSAAIGALEKRYGTALFDRLGRRIELTEAGRRFLPEARAVLERAATARSVLEDLSGLTVGALSIAASQTIATYWLPRRLADFHARYPGVRLDVTIANTSQVETAVAEGAADLGLVEGPTRHRALIRQPVGVDRLVLVVASDHPAPPERDGGRLDLERISWVIREAGSGTRDSFEAFVKAEGADMERLRVFLVLPSNEAVREAVEAGAGATVISEHVVARELAAGRLKALPVDLPEREFAAVRHPDRHQTKAQRALIELLTAAPIADSAATIEAGVARPE